MSWLIIFLLLVLVVIVWSTVRTAIKNADPAQSAAANKIIEIGEKCVNGEITERMRDLQISGIILSVPAKDRAHLATLVRVRAPTRLSHADAQSLYLLVAEMGRVANVHM